MNIPKILKPVICFNEKIPLTKESFNSVIEYNYDRIENKSLIDIKCSDFIFLHKDNMLGKFYDMKVLNKSNDIIAMTYAKGIPLASQNGADGIIYHDDDTTEFIEVKHSTLDEEKIRWNEKRNLLEYRSGNRWRVLNKYTDGKYGIKSANAFYSKALQTHLIVTLSNEGMVLYHYKLDKETVMKELLRQLEVKGNKLDISLEELDKFPFKDKEIEMSLTLEYFMNHGVKIYDFLEEANKNI